MADEGIDVSEILCFVCHVIFDDENPAFVIYPDGTKKCLNCFLHELLPISADSDSGVSDVDN